MLENKKLGPYELIRVLGRGGMGTVFEARVTGSEQHVAVKALAPAFSFDTHFRQRFEAEIETLLKLDHPNIVRLLGHGQEDGNLFFAMELVNGKTLSAELKEGNVFPCLQVIDIARQICAGLRHAHDRGIIHRDLKPGNLMMDPNNTLKITDFGIAKSFGGSDITSEGNVVGTMDFMAPEQARGKSATARSDLFSLGAVLYSLLAGRAPFVADSVDKTFAKLLSEKPAARINKVASGVPDELAKLIHRLLEKDPDRRVGTARTTERRLQYIIESLHDSSLEDTQVGRADLAASSVSDSDSDEHTFLTGAQAETSKGRPTIDKAEDRRHATKVSERRPVSFKAAGPQGSSVDSEAEHKPDYFNEVTSQQWKSDSILEPESRGRIWPIALAFVLVLGLTGYGFWYVVLRTPSADSLLATINRLESNPTHAGEEIADFLRLYPDHSEAPRVARLERYAKAIQVRNTLGMRMAASSKTLRPIERQFVNVTNLKDHDAPTALEKVSAFVELFKNDTLQADKRLVLHARAYIEKLTEDASKNIEQSREHIRKKMDDGRREASDNMPEARALFQSIIRLYQDAEWAKDLVDEARQELNQLEQLN